MTHDRKLMPAFNPIAEFEKLLPDFAQHHWAVQRAAGNAFVSIARVGFALHESPDRWGEEQEQFILALRAGDYSDESLGWYEEEAPVMASFACLALGALLGLFSRGAINDADFLQGLALLPAVLSERNEEIEKSLFP